MRSISYFDKSNSKFLSSIIIGAVSSVVVIAVLMCILSGILTATSLPPIEYLQYIMLIIIGIAVFLGGYIAARINKSKGLYLGIINGSIIYIALISSGFCMSKAISLITILKLIVCVLCSVLGGIKGVNIKDKIRIK